MPSSSSYVQSSLPSSIITIFHHYLPSSLLHLSSYTNAIIITITIIIIIISSIILDVTIITINKVS